MLDGIRAGIAADPKRLLGIWIAVLLVAGVAAQRFDGDEDALDIGGGLPPVVSTSTDESAGPSSVAGTTSSSEPAPTVPGTAASGPPPAGDDVPPPAETQPTDPSPSDPRPRVGPPFPTTCAAPSTHSSDPLATSEARCVYAAIEAFGQGRGDLPIGQQLNTARLTQRQPVSTLQAETYPTGPAATPAVIGTDLDAIVTYLDQTDTGSPGIVTDHIDALIADARAGRLVTASWHARSPFTGGTARDRAAVDLGALLDPATPAAQEWARQTDQIIGIIRRFADAGIPIAFRPLHEANLSAFWWGQADPAEYRAIWEQLRQRFEAAGIHNVIWVFAPNHPHSPSVPDPLAYTPDRFDVFGIDTYDPDDATDPQDRVRLSTAIYDRIIALGRPFALTEVGPLNSTDGRWDPTTITTAVAERYPRTAWALLWATFSTSNRMALVDLVGHEDWWSRCDDGTCPTTRPS
jgi:hypothetical protein